MPDRFGNIKINAQTTVSPAHTPSAPSQPPPEPSRPPKVRKPREKGEFTGKIFLFLGLPTAATGLILLFLYLFVPYYFTEMIPESFREHTNFELTVTRAKFNPLTFQLHLQKISLKDDENFPVADIDQIDTKVAPLSLLRLELVCERLEIRKSNIDIIHRNDNTYNISPLLGEPGSRVNVSDLIHFSDLPFFFSLNNIKVRDSRITFEDHPANKSHKIENINLDFPTLGNIPYKTQYTVTPKLSAVINGSPIELHSSNTTGHSEPNDATMSFAVSSLQITDYLNYLPLDLPITPVKGVANGELAIQVSTDKQEAGKLSVTFSIDLKDSEFISSDKKLTLITPNINVAGRLVPTNRTLTLKSLTLQEPQIISQTDKDLIAQLFKTIHQLGDNTEEVVPARKTYVFSLQSCTLEDGTYVYGGSPSPNIPDPTWENLNFSLQPRITSANGSSTTREFTISGKQTSGIGSFKAAGNIENANLTVNIETDLLNFAEMQPLFPSLQPNALKGTISGTFAATFPANGGANQDKSFAMTSDEAKIRDLEMTDKKNSLQAQELEVTGLKSANDLLAFDSLTFSNAHLLLDVASPPYHMPALEKKKIIINTVKYAGDAKLTNSKGLGKNSQFSTEISELKLTATNLQDEEPPKNNLRIEAKSGAGQATITGTLALIPFSWSGQVGFDRFQPKDIFGTFANSPFLAHLSGEVGGEGMYLLPQHKFVGQLHVRNGAVKTQDGQFTWQDAHIKDLNYTASPLHIGISDLIFTSPEMQMKIRAESPPVVKEISEFLRTNLPALSYTENPSQKVAISPLDIQHVVLNNGRLEIEDSRYKPLYQTEATITKGIISDLRSSSQTEAGLFSMNGDLHNATFSLEGKVNLLSPQPEATFQLKLNALPLAEFTEQLQGEQEISNESGTINLALDASLSTTTYKQEAKLTLDDIRARSLDSDIALTLALLSSPSGLIHLQIGSETNSGTLPGTTFEAALLQLQTLAVKASLSPLLLATGDFTDLIGHEIIGFEPGEFMLTPAGRQTLNRYAALLIQHPHIGLRLTGGLDRKKDEEALIRQQQEAEQKRVANENKKRFALWEQKKAEYDRRIAAQQQTAATGNTFTETDIPRDFLTEFEPLKPVPIIIDEEMLQDLAEHRKAVLRDHFTTQLTLAPERIQIDNAPIIDANTVNNASGGTGVIGVNIELRAIK